MTGYGAPPSPPQSAGRQPAESGRPDASPPPVFDLVGAVLGLVVFVLGFLPWYGTGTDIKGYYVGSAAPAVIGLSVLAGTVAAAGLLEKPTRSTVVPLSASVAALLVVFGMLVAKGDNIDVKIGLVLTLIVAILQVGAFVLGWLQANGRIMVPRPQAASGWGSPQYGYQSSPQPSYGPPPGYGQAPYGQSPSYGQPPFGQPPSYGQSASAWTPQPGYRQPQGPGSGQQGQPAGQQQPGQQQPGLQQPGQHQAPPQSGQPAGQPGQPPQQTPPPPTSPRPGSYGPPQGGQSPYPSNSPYGQPPAYAPPPPPGQPGGASSYGQTQVFPPSRPQQPGQQPPGQQPGQPPGQRPPGQQPGQQPPGQDAGEGSAERPGPSR